MGEGGGERPDLRVGWEEMEAREWGPVVWVSQDLCAREPHNLMR